MTEDRDGTDCETTMTMISEAALGGAYRALAREYPGHEGGFLKLADRQSRRVAALAGELIATAGGLVSPAVASTPVARRDGAQSGL